MHPGQIQALPGTPKMSDRLEIEALCFVTFDQDSVRTLLEPESPIGATRAGHLRQDLVRIDVHRGVEDLLFHTLRLKRLCAYAVDTR